MSANATNTTYYEALSFVEKQIHNLSYFLFNHRYGWLLSDSMFTLIAVTIITIGSFASLSSPFYERPKDYAKYHRKLLQSGKITDLSEEDQDDPTILKANEGPSQMIDTKYAMVIPFMAAGVLLSLNYVIKNIDANLITKFFDKYTLFMFSTGLFKVVKILLVYLVEFFEFEKDAISTVFPKIRVSFAIEDTEDELEQSDLTFNPLFEDVDKERPYFKPLKDQLKESKKSSLIFQFPSALKITQQFLNVYISSFDILSICISLPLIFLYVKSQSKNWVVANMVAFTLSVSGIITLKFSDFMTGAIVLIGLFFYDIYFVFGSDVMINVAKGIDAPLMIKIPSGSNYPSISPNEAIPLGMLGLGDIVIPGAFIALCLRYDVYRHYKNNKNDDFKVFRPIRKTYFTSGLISYIFGLILTYTALHLMERGQPALLYLSPSLIIGVLITSFITGDFKNVYKFEDIEENLLRKKHVGVDENTAAKEKDQDLTIHTYLSEDYNESEDEDYAQLELEDEDEDIIDEELFDYQESDIELELDEGK